jgi:diaminopimelate epimerase
MGNPHFVIFVDDVSRIDVGRLGSGLERHKAFPARCNIEFAHVEDDGKIRCRVWERGSGITQACGTGACATAVAAAKTGCAGRTSSIVMDGGTLSIRWDKDDNHVYMTGGAEFVFDGEIPLP